MDILNPEWQWKHLFYIRSEDGIVKIKRRPEQIEFTRMLQEAFDARRRENFIVLKPRQIGLTTPCAIFCMARTAYYPGKVANTLADSRDRASNIFENVVKLAWDRIPDGLKPKAGKDNVNELIFNDIGSKYIVSATKSEPVDILHISEAPYFPDEQRITEAEQMVRRNGIEIMESTAFGVGNLFEKRYMDAWLAKQQGKRHHWRAIFYPWYIDPKNTVSVHPDMEMKNRAFIEQLTASIHEKSGHALTPGQQFFYDQKLYDLEDEVFQFYPTEPEEAFLASGRPVFNLSMLKELSKGARQPIRIDDEIEIFAEPDDELHYGIGVDTAEGLVHGDNSVVSVVCLETGEEVAQVAGKISAIEESELAAMISRICRMYRNHLCVIERNNHGHTVIAYVKDDMAVTLYQRQEKDKITERTTAVIGWNTDHRSKAIAIDTLKSDLKSGRCIPRSYETLNELRVFVHGERGTMGAIKGSHDDRVMALALANMACREMVITGSTQLSDHLIY